MNDMKARCRHLKMAAPSNGPAPYQRGLFAQDNPVPIFFHAGPPGFLGLALRRRAADIRPPWLYSQKLGRLVGLAALRADDRNLS